MRLFSRFFLYTLFGWKTTGKFPKELKKYLIIAAPHTHWYDFPLGVAINYAEDLKANYIGKASLFKPPFGFIFKWLGGAPVDRSKSNNKVEAIISIFNSRDRFILAMSPEGTRQRIDPWKTGFYYIAKGANIPIVMVGFDFENKIVKIAEPINLSNNMDADLQLIYKHFENIKGKIPENFNL